MFLGGSDLQPFPPLLLFHPDAVIRAKSRAGAKELVRDTLFLLQAVDTVQRTIVWPKMDCESRWMTRNPSAAHGLQDHRIFASGSLQANNRECFDIGYMNMECSRRGALRSTPSSASSLAARLVVHCGR